MAGAGIEPARRFTHSYLSYVLATSRMFSTFFGSKNTIMHNLMASIYPRGRVWWIAYRDADGALRRESTGMRVDNGRETRSALELEAEKTLAERKTRGPAGREGWHKWVDEFITLRYANKPQSLLRYQTAWRTVRMFLEERGIQIPRQLTREHCFAYFAWRNKANKSKGKYRADHNTALLEIKFLALVMKEAVLRGYAGANPCRELGIKRAPVRKRPMFQPEWLKRIEDGIAAMPEGELKEFLAVSHAIAVHQGCRLSETHLNPLTQVNIPDMAITFNAKGAKEHCTALHPALVPMFEAMQKAGKTETYAKPKSPSKMWFNFLTKIGLKQIHKNVCFHSYRVSVATWLAQRNVHERKAMRYIGHASTTVHGSYQRLDVGDSRDAASAL